MAGCFEAASEEQFRRAEALLSENKTAAAEKEFEEIFEEGADKKLVLASARHLYEISFFQTKNYKKALRYLDTIISNADSYSESMEALKKKAFIEHKNLSLYEPAIASYSRLLSNSSLSLAEEQEFRLNLVKCLFAINKFEQAKLELKPLFDPTRPLEIRLAAKNLEASIFQSEGNLIKAVESYKAAFELATTDNEKQEIAINIALCYEQNEQYEKAYDVLDKLGDSAPFLDEKKKQLARLARFQGRRLNR